jgi:hypothetical protein
LRLHAEFVLVLPAELKKKEEGGFGDERAGSSYRGHLSEGETLGGQGESRLYTNDLCIANPYQKHSGRSTFPNRFPRLTEQRKFNWFILQKPVCGIMQLRDRR